MKKIELQLKINGETKTFTCAEAKGILFMKTLDVAKIFESLANEITREKVDKLVDYMVEVFNNQFTREEFYDGIDLSGMLKKIQETAETIIDMAGSEI